MPALGLYEDEDLSAERFLLEIKHAVLAQIRKVNPKAAFVEIALKICDRELPSWSSKFKRDANLGDYKTILDDFLSFSEKDFLEMGENKNEN